jgi:hypothetical protein
MKANQRKKYHANHTCGSEKNTTHPPTKPRSPNEKKEIKSKRKRKANREKNYHANHAYRSEKKTTTPTMHKGRSLNN